ncbi:uncharacterized protein [Nicotiana sylvestris]|uniref:uncharacterized protein n=1 Tax=Nicotiana sylvestris TaxID=4096 RepID=UPI00388CB16C
MVDSKYATTQVQELQVINHDLLAGAMIEKLPPLWKDFKNYLKHKCKEMLLEELIVRLRIEEDNKVSEKKGRENSTIMGTNIVEDAPQNKIKKKEGFWTEKQPKQEAVQWKLLQLWESWTQIYRLSCSKEIQEEGSSKHVENPKEWWIDYGATHHVCVVREVFAIYAPIGPEETLSMGNSATVEIEGCGKIYLKMTFGKMVILNNVLHVPEIRKNLVSA